MSVIYNVGILSYGLMLRIAALWNSKASKWVSGRKGLVSRIESETVSEKPRIWMHCPSLGEFEQGRPLLEELRKTFPDYEIILTFFSPSGFENQKNYPGADRIYYLPDDTPGNAKRVIKALCPEVAIFVKYDFWLNYLKELKSNGTITILASGIFRKEQHFFGSFPQIGRKMLTCFDHFFVQDQKSLDLLQKTGYDNVTKSGDTRFDRVKALADHAESVEIVKEFSNDHFTVVAGSTWPADEKILIPLINDTNRDVKWVLAPHELSEKHFSQLERSLNIATIRYSNADGKDLDGYRVLIVDNIGLLSRIYQYGRIAYVGGGFGKSIHNILESAAWGTPIIFGPRHEKFAEAHALLENGGAQTVDSKQSLESAFDRWHKHSSELEQASHSAVNYVNENAGGTDIISTWLKQRIGN